MKNNVFAFIAAAGMVFAVAAEAEAAGSIKSGKKAELIVGGAISRAILMVDDGATTSTRNVDNAASNSQITFEAAAPLTPTIDIGALIAGDVVSNSSDAANAAFDADDSATYAESDYDLWFTHRTLGTLTLGSGSMASDGISETDLSGTALGGYSAIADMSGGFHFVNSSTSNRSTTTIGNVADNMDGLDTADRVRYDTPEFGGFHARFSSNSSGSVDAALGYAGEFAFGNVEATVGWYNTSSNGNNEDTFEQGVSGSVSALLKSGFNLTLAAGTKTSATTGRDDPFFWYGKLGYIARLNALGNTNFAVDFGQFEDLAQNGDTLDTIGVQVVQDIDQAGANIYLAYRHHSLDRSGSNFEDINSVMAGAFLEF